MDVLTIPIPSAVTAGTEVDISEYATKDIRAIRKCLVFTGSDGTAAAASDEKTVVNTTPAAGEVQLSSPQGVTFGDALTARDIVVLVVEYQGEYLRP